MWDEVLAVDHYRGWYGNFASLVPLDSGVENWCMTNRQKQNGVPNIYHEDDRFGSDIVF